MSSNEPFSYLDPETGGVLLGRQTLCTQDGFSRAWLSVMPVGRSRDAYRAEDIADHLLETVAANGLPRLWRLERGVWENNFIDGIPLGDGTRWGGLRALFQVERATRSRGKGGIESSFNFLQSFLAHESLSIGRKRGEFEKGTKAMMGAKAGDGAAACNFWAIGECANAFQSAMKEFNATAKRRRAFGRDTVAPCDLYRDAVRRECPPEELWRFCPIKKAATMRRNGTVEVSVPHYPRPFCFRVNGEAGTRYFGDGHAVLIAFHPGHPERGCHVFNNERGAANRDGLKVGEFILLAPAVADASQFGQSVSERERLARKQARAAVTQEFRSIMAAANQISTVRDSYGQSVRREVGVNAPAGAGGDSLQTLKARRAEKRDKEADAYQEQAARESRISRLPRSEQEEAASMTDAELDAAGFAHLQAREKAVKESLGIFS